MDAGKLNKEIILQIPSHVQDSSGSWTDTWNDHDTVWAYVQPLSGREYFDAQQVQSEITTVFTIRYRKVIHSSWRISYGGKYYDIIDIIDKDEKHTFLDIMCKVKL